MAESIKIPVSQMIHWNSPGDFGSTVTSPSVRMAVHDSETVWEIIGSAYFQLSAFDDTSFKRKEIVDSRFHVAIDSSDITFNFEVIEDKIGWLRGISRAPQPGEIANEFITSDTPFIANMEISNPIEYIAADVPVKITDRTTEEFPALQSTLENGVMWHYAFPGWPEGSVDVVVAICTHLASYEPARPYLLIEYEPIVLTPTNLSPSGVYLENTQEITFSWDYERSSDNAIELPVPATTSFSWLEPETGRSGLVKLVNGEMSYTTVPMRFSPGKLQWRVSIVSNDGVYGPYSELQEIVLVGPPAQPTDFRARGTGRPSFSWISIAQAAWRIQIQRDGQVVLDTGFVAGADRSYQCPEYFPYGEYTATLWLRSRFGMDSEPVTANFEIIGEDYDHPILTAQSEKNSVLLKVSYDVQNPYSPFGIYYIYRDGVMIHKFVIPSNGIDGYPYEWRDYSAGTSHIYFVRAIDTFFDLYADSNSVWGRAQIENALLSDPRTPQYPLALKLRRGEEPVIEGSQRNQGQAVFFTGRRSPVYEVSEHWAEDWNFGFSFRNRADFDRLRELVGRGVPLLYRDYRGERCYIAVTGLEYTSSQVSWDFTISATRIDYVEEVDY